VVEVKNNWIKRNAYGEGINLKSSTTNGLVHHNIVENTYAIGIYTDASSGHNKNISIYNNIVNNARTSCYSPAAEAGGILEDVIFYNNIGYNCGVDGIEIPSTGKESAIGTLMNITIINNVFYNTDTYRTVYFDHIPLADMVPKFSINMKLVPFFMK
jgi:hypothetical protein